MFVATSRKSAFFVQEINFFFQELESSFPLVAPCFCGAVPMAPKKAPTPQPNAAHAPLFKVLVGGKLTGNKIVRQGNVMIKLARLSFHGDYNARGVVPMMPGTGGQVGHSSGPLDETIHMPQWLQQVTDKRFGLFDWHGPVVYFRWRHFWTMFKKRWPRLPFAEPDACYVESGSRPSPQPWVLGPEFHFVFKGNLNTFLLGAGSSTAVAC